MASGSPQAEPPVEQLATQYPICKDVIKDLSKKWEKRTKKFNTKWPAEGTFDLAMCREMGALIKNHKPQDKSKKRQAKREHEQEILNLFRDVGIRLAKELRDKVGSKKGELDTPPPYAPPFDVTGKQLPMMSGTVQIQGHVEFDDDERKSETEEEVKSESERAEVAGLQNTFEKAVVADRQEPYREKGATGVNKNLEWVDDSWGLPTNQQRNPTKTIRYPDLSRVLEEFGKTGGRMLEPESCYSQEMEKISRRKK